MLEREIEKKVKEYAESKGFLAWKFTSSSNRGVPDRIYISPQGFIGFIEFKQKDEELTAMQCYVHKELHKRNVDVRLIDDVITGRLVVDEWLQNKRFKL